MGALMAAAALAIEAVASWSGSNSACPNADRCETSLTPAQMFALAGRMQGAGHLEVAEGVLWSLTRDVNAEIRNEALFRIGQIHEKRSDWPGAAQAYRAVLDAQPLAGPVRLRLARVLVEMGDEPGALRQLRLARGGGLPENVVRVVNQFQAALRSRRRLGFGLEVGIAPDTNINSAQGRSIVEVGSLPLELSDDASAQSGLGFSARGQAYWRPPLSRDVNALITLNANANLYRKSKFDDIYAFLTAGPEFTRGRSRFRFSGLLGHRWFGLDSYSNSFGAAFNMIRSLDSTSQVQLDAALTRNDYKINPSLSGFTVSSSARYERTLSSNLSGRVTLRADRKGARDPAFATWTIGGEVMLAREAGSSTYYGQAGYYHTWADASLSFPPERRKDNLVDLEAGVITKRLEFWGLAPVIRLHWTKSSSPVFFYDIKRTRLEFAFTRDF